MIQLAVEYEIDVGLWELNLTIPGVSKGEGIAVHFTSVCDAA